MVTSLPPKEHTSHVEKNSVVIDTAGFDFVVSLAPRSQARRYPCVNDNGNMSMTPQRFFSSIVHMRRGSFTYNINSFSLFKLIFYKEVHFSGIKFVFQTHTGGENCNSD